MQAYEFIVIGAGIAGASAAYELAKIGSTVILERESQPGYHTTGRSAAVFSEIYGNATIRGLTVGSRSFFASPPAGFSEYPLWKARNSVMIARSDQLAKLRQAYDEWVRLVPTVRLLEGDEAWDVTPMLKPDYLPAASSNRRLMISMFTKSTAAFCAVRRGRERSSCATPRSSICLEASAVGGYAPRRVNSVASSSSMPPALGATTLPLSPACV
jgi:glycine/D-amino acid oxidase-like deaminating enzyme